MKSVQIACLASLALVVASCGGTSNRFSRAGLAADAKTQLLGTPKAEILACMGVPAKTAAVSGVEVWTYFSGGDSSSYAIVQGQSTGSTTLGSGIIRTRRRYCEIDMVFEDDRVSRVNYRGRTGGLITEGEQCAFAVAPCVE